MSTHTHDTYTYCGTVIVIVISSIFLSTEGMSVGI